MKDKRFIATTAENATATDSVISFFGSMEEVKRVTRNYLTIHYYYSFCYRKKFSLEFGNGKEFQSKISKVMNSILLGAASEIKMAALRGEAFYYNRHSNTWCKITDYTVSATESGKISVHITCEDGETVNKDVHVGKSIGFALSLAEIDCENIHEHYIEDVDDCIFINSYWNIYNIYNFGNYDLRKQKKLS